jgi:hypothetical protein
MTHPKAPPYHVWGEIEPRLWKCRYCSGWATGASQPDKEQRATSEEKARQVLGAHSAGEKA